MLIALTCLRNVSISTSINCCVAQAPAIQLSEHAKAILLDDEELGFERKDPVLQRLAKGSKHAATWNIIRSINVFDFLRSRKEKELS